MIFTGFLHFKKFEIQSEIFFKDIEFKKSKMNKFLLITIDQLLFFLFFLLL